METLLDLIKNPILLLGLAGAAIGLAASVTKTISSKPSRLVLIIFAVIGFLALATQQIVNTSMAKQSATQRANIERIRDSLIVEIRGKVEHTEDLVLDISSRLRNSDLSTLGAEIVTVVPQEEGGQIHIEGFWKGSSDDWWLYSQWISENRGHVDKPLGLVFNMSPTRSYNTPMILAYLFTSPATESKVSLLVEGHNYDPIATESWVEKALLNWDGVEYVVFCNNDGVIIAYASAQEFALELLLRMRHDPSSMLRGDRLLNGGGGSILEEFPMALGSVIQTSSVETLVHTMLNNKWESSLAQSESGWYLVKLSDIVGAES